MKRIILLPLLVIFFQLGFLHSAVFTVTGSADSGPGSLRQAVSDANTSAGADTIFFDPGTNGTPIVLSTGPIIIMDSVFIQGNGHSFTIIDANSSSTAFTVSSGFVNLVDLGVKNGIPNLVEVSGGSLSLYMVELSGASSFAVNFSSVAPSSSDLYIDYSYCYNSGGGFTGNFLDIYVSNSTFSGHANESFLVNDLAGSFAWTNCTFFNSAFGIRTPDPLSGNTGTILNCTFTANSTGLLLTETNSNCYSVSLVNNILFGNTTMDIEQDTVPFVPATPINQIKNVVGSCLMQGINCPAWYSQSNPNFAGSLGNNGGLWPTVALSSSSLNCIDSADAGYAPPMDQRGFSRVGGPDIGAFEYASCGLTCSITNYSSPTCFGMSNGMAEADPQNGAAPFNFSWSNGSTSQAIQNVAAGTYSVTVTDLMGCIATATISLVAPPQLIGSATTANATCFNEPDGSSTVTASGGTPPYYYYWLPDGQGSSTATGLTAGTYTCVLTDDWGCETNVIASVNQPSQIIPSVSINQPTCNNFDGSLTANASGGTGAFNFYWSTGNNSSSISGIGSGAYMLDVEDGSGCMVSTMVNVSDAGAPSITILSLNNVTCTDSANGNFSLNISGGTSPFFITWSDMDTSYHGLTRSNLWAGPYDIMVMDGAGCISMSTINVSEPALVDVNFSITESHCGSADGNITALPFGGTAPYSFLWSANAGSATTDSVGGLSAGVYNLTITDANGCAQSYNAYLSDTVIQVMDATANAASSNCGSALGLIDITVFGGTPPYTYQWTSGPTSEDMFNINPGEYGVRITDNNNCSALFDFWVENETKFYDPEICMVTVDTSDEKNVIYFQQPSVQGIKEFRIYREASQAGVYLPVGVHNASDQSGFKDTVANADIHGWKYRISAYDSCGMETGMSEVEHRPVHLSVENLNDTMYLFWTDYIGTSSFGYYYIWRKDSLSGWTKIDSVMNPFTFYIDVNVPAIGGNIEYYIEIAPSFGCSTTRAIVNTSRSNIKNQMAGPGAVSAVSNETVENGISFFPNPASESLQFSGFISSAGKYWLSVFDVRGREVLRKELNWPGKKINESVKLDALSNGTYFIRIMGEGFIITRKFLKQ